MSKSSPIRGVREQFDRGWGAGRGIGDEVNKQLTRCPRGLGGCRVRREDCKPCWSVLVSISEHGLLLAEWRGDVAGVRSGVLIIQNKH